MAEASSSPVDAKEISFRLQEQLTLMMADFMESQKQWVNAHTASELQARRYHELKLQILQSKTAEREQARGSLGNMDSVNLTCEQEDDGFISFKQSEPTTRVRPIPEVLRRQSQYETKKTVVPEPRQSFAGERRNMGTSQIRPPLTCFHCGGAHLKRDCPRLAGSTNQEGKPVGKTPLPAPRRFQQTPLPAPRKFQQAPIPTPRKLKPTTPKVDYLSATPLEIPEEIPEEPQVINQPRIVPRIMGLRVAQVSTTVNQQTSSGEKFLVIDPSSILPEEQFYWSLKSFSEPVTLHFSTGDLTINASRDTAADILSINKQFVDSELILNNLRCPVKTYGSGEIIERFVPLVYVQISYKNWKGAKYLLVHEGKPDFLIGNDLAFLNHQHTEKSTSIQAVTRSQSKTMQHVPTEEDSEDDSEGQLAQLQQHLENELDSTTKTKTEPEDLPVTMGSEVFKQKQMEDPTLDSLRSQADSYAVQPVKQKVTFLWGGNGLLYREYSPKLNKQAEPVQLVIPQKYRERILQLAHDSPSSGHLGIQKTLSRISQHFYWPGISKTIKDYVSTCDYCQRTGRQTDCTKANMQLTEIPDQVLQFLQMDVLGLFVPTKSKKKYIISFICQASRWIEAYAISNLSAQTIASVVVDLCSRIGVPAQIICDQAGAFKSELMSRICEISGIKLNFSIPYHPESHGMVERGQQTLLRMIKTLVQEYGNIWDKLFPFVLFAYRSAPHVSLGGFSPSEVVFGKNLQGPLDLLRSDWEGVVRSSTVPVADFVQKLQEKLLAVQELARDNLLKAQTKQKYYHDKKARHQEFEVGDMVLVLNPLRPSKLEVVWEGPGEIIQKVGNVNYLVKMLNSSKKPVMYHVNSLKMYRNRSANNSNCNNVGRKIEHNVTDR
ncbi:uncharacterized protein LOC144587192 [Pogona vitticeps]